MVKATDKVDFSFEDKLNQNGFLPIKLRFARVGIQEYFVDGEILKAYRSDTEVFSEDSLKSWENIPITDEHPPDFVDSDNYSQYLKGYTIGKATKEIVDGIEYVTIDGLIIDKELIKKIKDGKNELSAGYWLEYDLSNGVSPNGEAYDYQQKNIIGNHIAIVDVGRCRDDDVGAICKIEIDNKNQNYNKGDDLADDVKNTLKYDKKTFDSIDDLLEYHKEKISKESDKKACDSKKAFDEMLAKAEDEKKKLSDEFVKAIDELSKEKELIAKELDSLKIETLKSTLKGLDDKFVSNATDSVAIKKDFIKHVDKFDAIDSFGDEAVEGYFTKVLKDLSNKGSSLDNKISVATDGVSKSVDITKKAQDNFMKAIKEGKK